MNRRGISVVEILVAALFLALLVIALGRLLSGTDAHSFRLGHLARATRLAQQLVEECQSRPISDYQNVFPPDLGTDPHELDSAFFPNTEASLIAFREEHQKSLQNFSRTMRARLVRNRLNQIREIWLEAEIRWTDRVPAAAETSTTATASAPRSLRAGGLIVSLEAR
jgi:Tfp pilus assembly protein PilV